VQKNLQKLNILPEKHRDPKTWDVSEDIFSYKLYLWKRGIYLLCWVNQISG